MALFRALLPWLGRRWGLLAVAVVVLVGVLVLRWKPVVVERQVVATGSIVSETMGTGTLDARMRATLGTKIAGRMVGMLADQGDRVVKDQPVARLDDVDLRRQVSAAEAIWRAAQSSVVRATADHARAQAVLDQAQRGRTRLEALREANITSLEAYEQVGERLAVAEADLARTAAAITEAEQQAAAAEETLRMQQARLAEATITAPFAGLVVRRIREVGDIVVPGAAVMTVVATDTLWIAAWVDESAIAAIAVGQPARIVFRSDPAHERLGEVVRVGREVDRESREFLVEVRIADPPTAWALGQRAEIFIRTAAKNDVIRLPWRFLRTREGVSGTWIDDHGSAGWRPLTLGLRGQDAVEVTGGLATGETVIISAGGPATTLREGQRISSR